MAANAKVVSAFNSSVIFEAMIAKVPIIVPAFAEAMVGSVEQKIGTLELGKSVNYANDENHFNEMIKYILDNPKSKKRDYTYEEKIVLTKYLGFYDGKSGLRSRNTIMNVLNKLK